MKLSPYKTKKLKELIREICEPAGQWWDDGMKYDETEIYEFLKAFLANVPPRTNQNKQRFRAIPKANRASKQAPASGGGQGTTYVFKSGSPTD